MKLMTKEIQERFKKIGSQEKELNPLVILKLFDPLGLGIERDMYFKEKRINDILK